MVSWLPTGGRMWARRPRIRTVLYTLFLLGTASTLLIAYFLLFYIAFPIRRAYYLERDYLHALDSAEFRESIQAVLRDYTPRRHLQPLIQDVPQLYANAFPKQKRFDESLGLFPDGTATAARGRGREYWIYLAATAPLENEKNADETKKEGEGEKEEEEVGYHEPTTFSHPYKTPVCADPAYICDAYNTAFDRISSRWHALSEPPKAHPAFSNALLRYVDCDVSPLLCNYFWGLGAEPVHLVHLEVHDDCDYCHGVVRCPVTWRFIALPVRSRLPWTRQVRVGLNGGGSTVVPAFPDAEEQMWSLMSQPGAVQALNYSNPSSEVITVRPPLPELAANETGFLGLHIWQAFRMWADDPLPEVPDKDVWMEGVLYKCYVEVWVDKALRWWDGEPRVVRERNCEQAMKKYEADRRIAKWLMDKKMGRATSGLERKESWGSVVYT